MEEEKNGMDNSEEKSVSQEESPQGSETPQEESPQEEAAPQDDGQAQEDPDGLTPEERAMLEMSDQSIEDIKDDASDDAGGESDQSEGDQPQAQALPPDQALPDNTPNDENVGEGAAPEEESIGSNNLLSQDDIDQALGDMANQMGGDFGTGDVASDDQDVKQADFQQLSATSDKEGPRNIELLMDVELPISIELGRTRMRISDILALGPGSIVELDKLVGEPVDLLVNQKCVAQGEVVVVEESFGLRITQLISPEERLKNLA